MTRSILFVDPLESRCLLSADLAVSFAGKIPASIPVIGKSHITVQLTSRGDSTASGPATVQLYASPTQSIDPGRSCLDRRAGC